MTKKVRSERVFRDRLFRGAKIEDALKHIEMMTDRAEIDMTTAKTHQMKFFYEAQKHSYENISLFLKQEFQYDQYEE
jgi:hypothetical protein